MADVDKNNGQDGGRLYGAAGESRMSKEQPMSNLKLPAPTASAISIEVDGRQQFVFETDKLQEMLGASRIIANTVKKADLFFKKFNIFSLVSGEVKVWTEHEMKNELLNAAWDMMLWLEEQGLAYTVAYLETYREHFEEPGAEKISFAYNPDDGSISDPGPGNPNLAWVHRALIETARSIKNAKTGENARPTCSLFANCRMTGFDGANFWYPDETSRKKVKPPIEDDSRRLLVGWRSAKKREEWWEGRKELYGKLIDAAIKGANQASVEAIIQEGSGFTDKCLQRWSQRFDLFKQDKAEESYIAYACGDGDGMGSLLSNLHWNDNGPDRWKDERKPWERSRNFSTEYEKLVNDAFSKATCDVYDDIDEAKKIGKSCGDNILKDSEDEIIDRIEKISSKKQKMLPQLLGGDDLWMVGEKVTVLQVCQKFIIEYQNLAETDGFKTLQKALHVAHARQTENEKNTAPLRYTVSMGITFAKRGHPVGGMIDMAESLMKSAKKLRNGGTPNSRKPVPLEQKDNGGNASNNTAPHGCLDWHWVESTLAESLSVLRSKGWMYRGTGQETMLLTTRPWTGEETGRFIEAAALFQNIPRRKREQLEEILRLGKTLGDLAWKSWRDGLEEKHRELLNEVNEKIPKPLRLPSVKTSPWCKIDSEKVYMTPLIDLLALQHVFNWEGNKKQDEGEKNSLPQTREVEE